MTASITSRILLLEGMFLARFGLGIAETRARQWLCWEKLPTSLYFLNQLCTHWTSNHPLDCRSSSVSWVIRQAAPSTSVTGLGTSWLLGMASWRAKGGQKNNFRPWHNCRGRQKSQKNNIKFWFSGSFICDGVSSLFLRITKYNRQINTFSVNVIKEVFSDFRS